MTVPRRTDDGSLIADILRRLANLERAAQLGSAAIGSGGLQVTDGGSIRIEGGELVITDADGAEAIIGTAGLLQILAGGSLRIEGGELVVEDESGNDAIVTTPGSLEVRGEGKVVWKDAAGVVRFEMGRLVAGALDNVQLVYFDDAGDARVVVGEFEAGGSPVHGILIENPDGTNVGEFTEAEFNLYGPGDVRLIGNAIDPGDVGLDRPYLAWNVARVSHTTEKVDVTSSSYVNTHRIDGFKQHPRIQVGIVYHGNSAAGNIQLYDETSATVLDTITVNSGDFLIGSLLGAVPGSFLDVKNLRIRARRTSGTGTIEVSHRYAYGRD